MDQFPQMLYRAGGPELFEGSRFSTVIVQDESELEAAMAGGWHETWAAAKLADLPEPPPAPAPEEDSIKPPTRDELEQKAKELGIAFHHNTGDKKLADLIAAKLAEQGA
jgi:hypothetical protein